MKKPPPLPLEEAQARLLDLVTPLDTESLPVPDALGRFLAEPLAATRTQPPADLSAMDGYALDSTDMAGPWQVVGESSAGHPFEGQLKPGEAARIATGALIPASANAVILQEDITREGDRIALTGDAPEPPGKHIRKRGMDFAEGDTIMAAGTRLGSSQAALAISAGHANITVRRKPRVAILDSGDELCGDPSGCAPHQIPASNGVMLSAMAQTLPCEAQRLGPVADTMEALAAALDKARNADLVVTSGGASVGDHDLVRPAMEAWGAKIDFWRVAIKPGKPLLVATRDRPEGKQIILGLPGNPVSSHVTAYLFMLPVLRAMLGSAAPFPRSIRTRLGATVRANGTRREFMRAIWDGESVRPQVIQDSGALAALAASNVLIDRPANSPEGQVGDEVPVFLLENGGIA